MTYVEDGDDAGLMAGAATILWEMLERQPELDTVLVPTGGGNLIAATLLAAERLRPELRIVGVQSSAAPGATRSWLDGEVRSLPSTTEAGGLATEYPGGLSLKVMLRLLETIVLVTEEDLWRAVGAAFRATGYPIELAGAAGF